METRFRPGNELGTLFHEEVVAPLLAGVAYAAARVGPGSDVLGFDTPQSVDHGWGPSLQVFVAPADVPRVRAIIDAGLPESFHGWPVRFSRGDDSPVRHFVGVDTLPGWLRGHLHFEPAVATPLDWLAVPQQRLLEATAGPTLADPDGELGRVRAALMWFPDQVHRYLLACAWARIAQEEAFVGRTAQVGDELGSRILAARLARDVMRVAFLLARRYWPYPKWFGSAFARLPIAGELSEQLARAVSATGHAAREAALVEAYGIVARAHNASGLTVPVDPAPRPFHERPFLVLGAERFAEAAAATLTDPWLRGLPLIGSVDMFADSTDLLDRDLRAAYAAAVAG
ncbi:DUF4037 domain-containing protein [Pseudonocardia sp. CA-107938]|uniref:DUF4037 domain-containing protein n=1 Tax=Pseudonocardia sp. CA-107938 TaxID=3240021 RepID=UPI003D923CE8